MTFVIMSCSKEESPDHEKPGNAVNQAPSQPALLAPEDELYCTSDVLTFNWSPARDPQDDEITYKLEISLDEQFSDIFASKESSQTTNTISLNKGEIYYWRVLATDEAGNESSFSDTRIFFTEAEPTGNYLPSAPIQISPSEGENISKSAVTLEWSASDADEDLLLFDLYLGKSDEPEIFVENLNTNSYRVDLESQSTYYWRVVVKDEQGGNTTGRLWSFETK